MEGTRGMSEYEWAVAKQQQVHNRRHVLERIREGTPDEEFTVIITSPVTGIGLASTKEGIAAFRDDVEYARIALTPASQDIANKYPDGW